MGKKVKKKTRSGHKDKRVSSDSPKEVILKSTENVVTSNDKVVVVKDRSICPHLEKGINLEELRTKFGSTHPLKCDDCREGVDDRRASKGKGKQGKKKGGGGAMLESKSIWICLVCAQFSCGGAGLPTTPQSHAIRHARMNHHQLTVKLENPQLCWCFGCSTLVHYEKSEAGAAAVQTDILHEIVKMIKGWPREKHALDVEEIWFGSDSVSSAKREICAPVGSDWGGRYIVRGMTNLGNTCFFNSVMQNLLAIYQLRDYYCKLDASLGPLTTALRKLIVEMNENSGSRGSINPKAFFGCVCAKAPQFRGYQQQDSHEFLRCLLDGLSTEELSVRKKIKSTEKDGKSDPTFVEAVFGGQLCSMVTCLECEHSSIVYEPFLDLSLPVPTRKSPSRKARPEARARKPKLPPRRNGKTRPKSSTDPNALSLASSSDKFPCEQAPEGQSSKSTAEKDEPKLFDKNDIPKQAPPSDFSWLDYLDNDVVSSTTAASSEICDLPLNQEYAAEEAGHNDLRLQDSTDCSEFKNEVFTHTANSPDKVSLINNDVQDKLSDFQDLTSQVNEKLVLKDSSDEFSAMDVASSNDKDTCLDANSQTCSRDLEDVGVKQSSSFREEDSPSLVQDNVVLLLPYESITRTEGEASTSSLGNGQDSLEFDGLGGLFDEPDDAGIPDLNPSTFDQPLEGTKKVGAGFMYNNSESEPDEVDNTDVPISVERCLSYFIKSELLTKNEHAWQCENCSKILQERIKLRKKSQNPPLFESLLNQNVDRQNASGPFSVPNGVSHLSNGEMNQKEVNAFNCDCVVESSNQSDLNSVASQCKETQGDECLYQVNGDNRTLEDLNVEKSDAAPEGDILSASGESESSDDENTNSESVKVERDATKRILIDKAPRVLTIHLKRFSQDARGRLSKLNGHVQFNHTIDLKPYIIKRSTETDEYIYRLLGVVEHSGTMRNGHYVAYVRGSAKSTTGKGESTEDTCVWYYASDAYVRECSLEEVLRSDAYILFYERV